MSKFTNYGTKIIKWEAELQKYQHISSDQFNSTPQEHLLLDVLCHTKKPRSGMVDSKPKVFTPKEVLFRITEAFFLYITDAAQLENSKQLLASCPCRICYRIWHPSTFMCETY